MKVCNKEFIIPKNVNLDGATSLRRYYDSELKKQFNSAFPIRFIISKTDNIGYHCEIDFIEFEKSEANEFYFKDKKKIFDFKEQTYINNDQFNAVMVIPTGVGAEIGGHCGDGNTAAKLIASVCDRLIVNPNVVNASDINEMTENTLYVEGSILTRFMMGMIGLAPVRSNRILMIMDKNKDRFFNDEIVNAVSSARVTIGVDCDVLEIQDPFESGSLYSSSGRTVGKIEKLENLFKLIKKYKNNYDAIGLSTIIKVPKHFNKGYFTTKEEIINPWGGTEAMITHSVAESFAMPCAHSPMCGEGEMHLELGLGIVDPRKAPETASVTYLHCILKGLHQSPRIVDYGEGINAGDISCFVIPEGCIGLPVLACLENGIPVIAVRNKNIMKNDFKSLPFRKGKLFFADNYLEAAGIMSAIKSGISPESLDRPIKKTKVL